MAGSGRQRETDEWRGRHCPAPIGSEIFRAPHQHASVARDGHPGSVRGAIDGVIETKRVSYNIQYGTGREGVVDLARIARAVQGADVIALQEIERFSQRTELQDQPALLAELLPGYHCGKRWFRFRHRRRDRQRAHRG